MKRVVLLASLLVLACASQAGALEAAGVARIVSEAGTLLHRGNAADVFTIDVPDGAACQGDSMDGGYRVQSFLLPKRFAPGEMKWGELAPTAPGSFAFYDTATNPYVHGLTAIATEKGGPGAIANTPMFSFKVFLDAPELLTSGRYHAGLACSLLKDTTRYWSTEVDIRVDTSKAGADQVVWRVTNPVVAASGRGGAVAPIVIAVLGAVAVLVLVRRRRQPMRPTVGVAALFVVALVVMAANRPALADGGVASIVSVDTKAALTAGDRTTAFTLALPTGAACGGDSANDGYRVESYHVPASVDATTLTFTETGPAPSGTGEKFRQPLYATNTSPYVHAQTAPATPAPGPGTVINVPAFDFAQYTPEMVKAGRYKVGLACVTPEGRVEKSWEALIDWRTDGSWAVDAAESAAGAPPAVAAGSGVATSAPSSRVVPATADLVARPSDAPKPDEPTGAAPTMRIALGGSVGAPRGVSSRLLFAGALLVALRIGLLVRRSMQ